MGGTDSRTIEFIREDGTTDVVEASPGESILEATDETTMNLRYGCREGRCVSCTGLLLEGEIDYSLDPQALNESQRADGFVLLCIAHPVTDCRIRVGKSVLGAAFPTLWQTESGVLTPIIELEQASRELASTDDIEVSTDSLAEMRGELKHFENLHEVREAYRRAIETISTKRYH